MSIFFPSHVYGCVDRSIIGPDFDVVKRDPIADLFVGSDKRVFKFATNDRMIPSRNRTTSEFLKIGKSSNFDVSSSENDIQTMRKVEYQNHIRRLFLNQQEENERKVCNEKKKHAKKIKLIHQDWACKIPETRLKFLPDFETHKKPGFGTISNYIWSNKHIIAASSRRKVCLYHPFNGFTRALDITDRVCMAFSHSGESLAIAYRKSRRLRNEHDIYVFKIDQKELFDSENLDTEKLLTETPYDVTALCYSQHDNFLLCGTGSGAIFVLECKPVDRKPKTNESLVHNWTYVMYLQSSGHKNEIKKISFSAKFRYMATLDVKGVLTIWNGGSWTPILNFEAEPSRHYVHLEWHPFVEEELILGKRFYPALYLLNVAQKSAVACFMSWKEELELTSIAFNPITAQLAVCFYNREECVNRVSLLASMSQVINTFDFDYIEGGLKLFWNRTGTMLGAGAECFCFAFWSFHKSRDFHHQMVKCSTSKNPEIFPLNFMKMSSLR